jgi:hypothetical protein
MENIYDKKGESRNIIERIYRFIGLLTLTFMVKYIQLNIKIINYIGI